MSYTHNDKTTVIKQELESAITYLQECIKVIDALKRNELDNMDVWDAHLLLDKVHLVYRAVTRFPVINFVDIKASNDERGPKDV